MLKPQPELIGVKENRNRWFRKNWFRFGCMPGFFRLLQPDFETLILYVNKNLRGTTQLCTFKNQPPYTNTRGTTLIKSKKTPTPTQNTGRVIIEVLGRFLSFLSFVPCLFCCVMGLSP